MKRLNDTKWREKGNGGQKGQKFTEAQVAELFSFLRACCDINPCLTYQQYADLLHDMLGFTVPETFIRKLFQETGYSYVLIEPLSTPLFTLLTPPSVGKPSPVDRN